MDGLKEAMDVCGISDPYASLTEEDPWIVEDEENEEVIDVFNPKRFWKNFIFFDFRYLGSFEMKNPELERRYERVIKRSCGSITTYEIRFCKKKYCFRLIR